MSVAQLGRGRVPTTVTRAGRRDLLVTVSLVIIALLALMAVTGPWLTPYDPDELNVGPIEQPISGAHWLGTDDLGRDILSRVLAGARSSLVGPVFVVILSTVLGTVIGVAAAWYGGWVDAVLSRVIDVIFAIPGLVLAVLAVALFGKGLTAPVIALSIAYVPIVARLIRGVASAELARSYFEVLQVQGVHPVYAVGRHLVPALLPGLLAQCGIGFGYAMLDLAAISYLGLGVQPPAADWGVMISGGQGSILAGAFEQSVYPALFIIVTVLAVNIVGARITAWAESRDK